MEKRDLYDLNKNLTGEVVIKGENYPLDRRILVVGIWIENSKGELLIQKRKDDNFWATTGGHPKSGESSLDGIITEVKEELGLELLKDNIKFIHEYVDELVFCDLYYINTEVDIDNLVLQEEEVVEAKWVTIEEIELLIKNNEFKNVHKHMYYEYLEYKNNN